MKKGKFIGHDRKKLVFPTNFRYDPSPPSKRGMFKPIGLSALMELRRRLASTNP